MLNYRIRSLACMGGLAFSLCANTPQNRSWHYLALLNRTQLDGNELVEPNTGNRAALYSWVDEKGHTTTFLVGVKDSDGNHIIRQMIYNLSEPNTPKYSTVLSLQNDLKPRNIFRSPEGNLYLVANNGNKGDVSKGEVWISDNYGTSWEKMGDHINDGHIAFYTKTVGINEKSITIIRVGIPGRESTEIVVTNDESDLRAYKKEIHYKGNFDPKTIKNNYICASFTTVTSSTNTTEVGEMLVGHDGTIKHEHSLLSAQITSSAGETIYSTGCKNTLETEKRRATSQSSQLYLKQVLQDLTVENKRIFDLDKEGQNCHHRKCKSTIAENILARYEEQIAEIKKTINNNESNQPSNNSDSASIPQLRKENSAKQASELKVFEDLCELRESCLKDLETQVWIDRFKGNRKYNALIENHKKLLTDSKDTVNKQEQEIAGHNSTVKSSCDNDSKPTFIKQLDMKLLGIDCNYNSCVTTYDNSGFIASSCKSNESFSVIHNCGDTDQDLSFRTSNYHSPQEVIAQNDGSMAVVANNNIYIATNKLQSDGCQNIKHDNFGRCANDRIMITGVHPTLNWSNHTQPKGYNNKRYNGIFLAVGHSSKARTADLGLYITPITMKINIQKNHILPPTKLIGKLTGEPSAKVIWWWQEKKWDDTTRTNFYKNIPAVENKGKGDTIKIKTSKDETLTVYIGEFDTHGDKVIPAYEPAK